MSSPVRTLAALAGAGLLAACGAAGPADEGPVPSAGTEALPVPGTAPASGAATGQATALPATGDPAAAPIPHIYLALQPGSAGRPHSVVFAIDAARDGSPSDDAAIRLTPENGNCNPQEMRRYDFPPDAVPVVSEAEQSRGLTARDLPAFLAAEVTGRMIDAGIAAEAEDTRPLNVCTRKLWESLVVAENRDRRSASR